MSEVIDRKFKIMAVNPCKMSAVYDETNSILFCAHDQAVPYMLKAYRKMCTELGCNAEHLESIDLLRDRILSYQMEVKKKIPDTDTDCEIARCIGGIGVGN